ncbi:MAG: hypothetical protein J1E34_06080 [Oscillospiraceae bacterium]|nr:hypothetical protein [Oscillospiraceae bacterium]
MPMSVEAAVITKKSALLDYNTDSVNAAGKLWPRETVHSEKGIRAAGICREKPYYVLSSSKTKGTAESAADLFKTCAENFSADGENASVLIADFFKAFSKVLIESGYESSDCDFSVFAGFGSSVYIGNCGKSRAYSYSGNEFSEVMADRFELYDGKSGYCVSRIDNVKEEDIFILLTQNVAETLTSAVVAAICKTAAGDIKKISALISSQAAKLGCTDAVSAIVLKIKDTSAEIVTSPQTEDLTAQFEAAAETASLEAVSAQTPEISDNQIDPDEEDKSVSGGKRAGVIILSVILAVLLIAIGFFAVKIISQTYFGKNDESTSDSTEDPNSSSDLEESSEDDSSSEGEESSSEEPATDESTSASESTTAAPTYSPVPSTTYPPQTTAPSTTAPSTTAPSTTAPSTTEPASESQSQSESESPSETTSEIPSENDPSDESSSAQDSNEEPEGSTTGENISSEPVSSDNNPENTPEE